MKVYNLLTKTFDDGDGVEITPNHVRVFDSCQELQDWFSANPGSRYDTPEGSIVVEVKEVVEGKGKVAICGLGPNLQTTFMRCDGTPHERIIEIFLDKLEKKDDGGSVKIPRH